MPHRTVNSKQLSDSMGLPVANQRHSVKMSKCISHHRGALKKSIAEANLYYNGEIIQIN